MEVDEGPKSDADDAIDGRMAKRRRGASAPTPSALAQKLPVLARAVGDAVRALVEADRRSDAEVDDGGPSAKTKTKETKTSTAPSELSTATSALERLVETVAEARRASAPVPPAVEEALGEWRKGLESSCSRLQDLLDSCQAPPQRHRSLRGTEVPPPERVAALAGPMARRLGFTSSAPAFGWQPGQPLPAGGARPPAPQEWQMRASGLRRLCAERFLAESEARAAAAAAAAAEKEAAAEVKAEAAAPASAKEEAEAEEAAPAPPPKEEPKQEEPPPAPAARPAPGVLPGFELVLNPDLEEVEEEFSSDYDSD